MSVSASSAASARVFMMSKWRWTTPMCDYCDGYIGFCARFPKYRRQIDGRVHGSQPRLRDRGNRASSVQVVPTVVADGQKLDRFGPADRTPPAWKPKVVITTRVRTLECQCGTRFQTRTPLTGMREIRGTPTRGVGRELPTRNTRGDNEDI